MLFLGSATKDYKKRWLKKVNEFLRKQLVKPMEKNEFFD